MITNTAIDWGKRITVEDKKRQQHERALAVWKRERQAAVDAITVTVDGMVFDGNEASQNRMARVIASADDMEQTAEWTLANNGVATVSMAQLKRVLALATELQTAIWNEGRPTI